MFATMLFFAGCNSDDFNLDLPEDMVITVDSVGFDGVRFTAKFQGYRNMPTGFIPSYSIRQDSGALIGGALPVGWQDLIVFGNPLDKTPTSSSVFKVVVDEQLKPNTTYWIRSVVRNDANNKYQSKISDRIGPAISFTTTAAPESSLQLSATAATVSATRVSVQLTISKGNQGLDVTKYGYTYVSEGQTVKEVLKIYSSIKTFPYNEIFSLTHLSPNTKYTIVPFAEDRYGRINGKPVEITTPDFDVNEYLSMTVNDVSSIGNSSAIVSVTYKKKEDFPKNVDFSFKIGVCYKEAAGTTWYKGEERTATASDMFFTYSWKMTGLLTLTTYQAGGFVELLVAGTLYKTYLTIAGAVEFKTTGVPLAVDIIGTYSQVVRSSSGTDRTGTVTIRKGIGANEVIINAWNNTGGDISAYRSITATVNTEARTVTIAPGVICYKYEDYNVRNTNYLNDGGSSIIGQVGPTGIITFGSWKETYTRYNKQTYQTTTSNTFYSSMVLTKK